MVAAQHAQIWSPMIFIKIIRNFYDSFVAGRRWLETLIKIAFLVLDASGSLLSNPTGLLYHDLTGLTLINILFILVMAFSLRFSIGLIFLSLGYLNCVLTLMTRLDEGGILSKALRSITANIAFL